MLKYFYFFIFVLMIMSCCKLAPPSILINYSELSHPAQVYTLKLSNDYSQVLDSLNPKTLNNENKFTYIFYYDDYTGVNNYIIVVENLYADTISELNFTIKRVGCGYKKIEYKLNDHVQSDRSIKID